MQAVRPLLLFALLFGACGEKPAAPAEVVRGVKTITVSERPQGAVRRFWGVLAATDRSQLAFEVGGRVREVRVEVGDRVTPGQPLAALDAKPYELAVEGASAGLQSSRARLADAERVRRNVASLHEQAVAARGSVEDAQNKQRAAAGDVERAQVAVELARRDLAHATLEAPFAGVIAERRIEPHQEVRPGAPALVIESDAALEVDLLVPEIFVGSVYVGQPVRVSVSGWDLRGVSFDGAVSQVGATASQGNAYPVRVALGSPSQRMRPGMTAEVEFTFRDAPLEEAWLVPLTALLGAEVGSEKHITEQDLFTFVYEPEGSVVRRRPVRILNVQGSNVLIREGLSQGDVVVVAGVHHLRDGQKVHLLENGSAGAPR